MPLFQALALILSTRAELPMRHLVVREPNPGLQIKNLAKVCFRIEMEASDAPAC